ncbi:dihydrolipoamide acetyltransferase family protein [Candidatus Poribacteria bacterium]
MAKPVLMPQIGENIEAGTIIEWKVKEGDRVNKGDVIVIVESEKAAFEVEAYESGVIQKILYSDGDEAAVLKPIAYYGQPGEMVEAEPEETPEEQVEQEKAQQFESSESRGSRFASPSARRIAREHGIELNGISGSGPRGRIIKRDVIAAVDSMKADTTAAVFVAESPKIERILTEDTEIPYSRMRKVIADRLTRSKQTIPHFYLFIEVDMTEALEWRSAYNDKHQMRVTVTDMLVKSVSSALVEFERMNAHADSEKIVLKKNINVGVAVSVSDGLLVPVIPDADQKDIQEISNVSKGNAEAARRGSLRTAATGTFTITNLGMYSVSRFLPIINPPECAILGVGSTEKKVVAIGDGIHIRDMMNLCLASDHRAVDGVYAAQFLNRIKEFMENNYTIL